MEEIKQYLKTQEEHLSFLAEDARKRAELREKEVGYLKTLLQMVSDKMETNKNTVSVGAKTAMDMHIECANKMREIDMRCLSISQSILKTTQDTTFLCTHEKTHPDTVRTHPY